MDWDWLVRSDEIRDILYDISEGGQLAQDGGDVLHSDDDVFDINSELDDTLFSGVTSVQNTDSTSVSDVNMEDQTDDGYASPPQIGDRPAVPPCAQQTYDSNLCLICKWCHLDDFTPNAFDFDSSQSGLTLGPDKLEQGKEIDFFHYLLDHDLVAHIVAETNKYCREYVKGNRNLPEYSKVKRWVDTTPDELYCFFCTLKSFWAWAKDPLLSTPIFSKVFIQDCFLLLLRMLHFDDSLGQGGADKLYKIRTVIETVRWKFLSSYVPDQDLVVDESLMLWKGRLCFRQYIPNKRKRFGVKLYVLCDCKSGIVLDFLIYTGKGTQYTETQSSKNHDATFFE
ncbi:piggyBac transposable element-derived protein 4-like [Homalodisca vitripennis]|uniref:piggyBac transposable element-derived protein 4-like n=1 Tax=Homalodisca vitripennis TaxID=197043 RepID=UPI001EEA29DD|nr:piggyBac transposable element-derived protein 4-like [Homalodisca vitripennis]